MDCQTVNKLNAKLMGKAKCFRSFKRPPKPSQAKLEEASREFYHGILSALRAKSLSPVYVKMDLDLWRYVSFNRGAESQHAGYQLYQIEDFSRFEKLPQNWWYFLNRDGEGQAVKSPLKIKPVLSWTPAIQVFTGSKLLPSPRMPLEKICVDILRRPCGVENLFQWIDWLDCVYTPGCWEGFFKKIETVQSKTAGYIDSGLMQLSCDLLFRLTCSTTR